MTIVAPWYRLGYIIPHRYTDMDAYQFYRVAPDGVMLVSTGLNLGDYSLAAVEAEMQAFWERVDLLAGKSVDTIALSGVPIGSVLGRRRVLKLLAEVAERSGVRADTDIEAHVSALQHLGVERLALASRWPADVLEALTGYLAEAGIEVVAVRTAGRDLAQNKAADPAADHELALELGRRVLRESPHAQGLMLPGGLWFSIHAAPILEAEFGLPVTQNITATLWAALHARGELPQVPDPHWGRLLAGLSGSSGVG